MDVIAGSGRAHVFDAVLEAGATNADLYNTKVRKVVGWVLSGTNTTVIAYGTTWHSLHVVSHVRHVRLVGHIICTRRIRILGVSGYHVF